MHEEIVASAARLDQVRQVSIGIANMRSAMRGASLFAMMHNTEAMKTARATFDATAAEMRKTIQQMESGFIGSDERTNVNATRSSLEQWATDFEEFADLSAAGNAEEASASALKKITPLLDVLQKGTAHFGQANSARRDAAVGNVETAIQRNEIVTYLFTALVLLAGGVGFFVVTGMAKTLREISESVAVGAQKVSQAAAGGIDLPPVVGTGFGGKRRISRRNLGISGRDPIDGPAKHRKFPERGGNCVALRREIPRDQPGAG